MKALFASLRQTGRPLRGVIHAAGTLETRTLAAMDATTLREVMRSKVEGGWLLHELTEKLPLDFLAFFSSGAAIWGSAGMGHYAAANHCLDALAHLRRSQGLPALTVNWGWWADGGIATAEVEQFFGKAGLKAMPAPLALATLQALLAAGTVQKIVAAIDWEIFKPLYEAARKRPLLDDFNERKEVAPEVTAQSFVQRFKASAPSEQRELLLAHVRESVATILGFNLVELLDVQQGFFKLGMDSLMTVQVRKRLESSLGCSLPSTIAFEYPSVLSLTKYLETQLLAGAAATPAAAIQVSEPSEPSSGLELDELSQEDLLALLESELTAVNDLVEGDRR
jgi:acyl carrier protein